MIVIDMDMPESCCECPICHPKGKDEPWNFVCFQEMMDINIDEWDEKRHPNCPIKCDIEDIKAEILFIIDKCLPNCPIEEYEVKGLKEALNIINKHLEGDRNDERRSDRDYQ